MLHHTRGIVFHQLKYSETSIIAHIYTELFGIQTYMIRGIRGKKSKIKPALFQHLSLVDLVVYHKEKKEIQSIREIKIAVPFKYIPYDVRKSSVLIFLNEVLHKVIKEEEANPELFNFLFSAVQLLDVDENNTVDFHLLFLMQLTKYLGFHPKNNFSEKAPNFNLEEGMFTSTKLPNSSFVGMPFSKYFSTLSNSSFDDPDKITIGQNHRNELLEIILRYYQLHIPVAMNIKSHLVLNAVLNG
jgi:DNA repair protein RecO (recombination protein O)